MFFSKLFGKSIVKEPQTNGFYSYKHRGKSRYGGEIEIIYIVLFQKLPAETTEEGYNYLAYTTADIDSDKPDFVSIKEAYKEIKSYNLNEPAFLHEHPNTYECMNCKVNNSNIEFRKDTVFDKLKIGNLMKFEGFVADRHLRLSCFYGGYNDSDKFVSEKVFSFAQFDFTVLE